MSAISYPTLEQEFETSIRYYFISDGNESIVKAIDYTYISDFGGKRVFNLAFGDYDVIEDKINDSAHSNNGDVYKVFNTVLNTIPKFFATFSNDIMMVQGSDSKEAYLTNCKRECKKNCFNIESCKNKDRRINVYRKYVNSNYNSLINEYVFLGGLQIGDAINIEAYLPEKKYDSVFVFRK